MPIEIEIKFEVKNIRELKKKLKKIRAKKIKRYFEYNLAFDTKDKKLYKSKILLRLRKAAGKVILGYKRKIPSRKYKQEEEIEIEVKDFEKMKKLLEKLGFYKSFIYEKVREVYKYKGTEICIDQLPFGTYLEIEGKEKDIKTVIDKLELDIKQGSTLNYRQLYNQYCKEKRIKPKDIVFKKK